MSIQGCFQGAATYFYLNPRIGSAAFLKPGGFIALETPFRAGEHPGGATLAELSTHCDHRSSEPFYTQSDLVLGLPEAFLTSSSQSAGTDGWQRCEHMIRRTGLPGCSFLQYSS